MLRYRGVYRCTGDVVHTGSFVYYESRKRELKKRRKNEFSPVVLSVLIYFIMNQETRAKDKTYI